MEEKKEKRKNESYGRKKKERKLWKYRKNESFGRKEREENN